MKIYNTLSRQKEKFTPLGGVKVGLYICGPTVYDYAHIGNLRTYAAVDFLVRTLEYFGYQVRAVENITDIDDKTIAAAKKSNLALKEYTRKYENIYFDDLKTLNILPAEIYCRATEHFREIKTLVEKLLAKAVAYEKDGSIYFAISSWPKYGQLVDLKKVELKRPTRVDADNYDKENAGDFVLWKKDDDYPAGRPGWHLECSAMSMKYLGETFDLHCGGVDLIFPHHENEIAQSEAATGKKFVKYWFHIEHLLVGGRKMAKSLNNFYTLKNIFSRGFSGRDLRYFYLNSHYRERLNFTWEGLESAQRTLKNIDRVVAEKREAGDDRGEQRMTREVEAALADDLNLPKALALLHQANDYHLWLKFEPVLGLGLDKIKAKKLTIEQEKLLKKREELRKAGRWEKADKIRDGLVKQGMEVQDKKTDFRI